MRDSDVRLVRVLALILVSCATIAWAGNAVPAENPGTLLDPVLGWRTRTPIPGGTSGVDWGGSVSTLSGICKHRQDEPDDTLVYALKGDSTGEFYVYNVNSETWTTEPILDPEGTAGENQTVYDGGTLNWAGGLYAAKGNGTLHFWEYDVETKTWSEKCAVPVGSTSIDAGGTSVGATGTTDNYVYLFKGAASTEFYRYHVTPDSWERLPDAPGTITGGSCITCNEDSNRIYAALAGYNSFFEFSPELGVWCSLPPLPDTNREGESTVLGPGGCMVYVEDTVFLLKGNQTLEFWRYCVSARQWVQGPDLEPVDEQGVGPGASLTVVHSGDRRYLYALFGSQTCGFESYPDDRDVGAPVSLPSGRRSLMPSVRSPDGEPVSPCLPIAGQVDIGSPRRIAHRGLKVYGDRILMVNNPDIGPYRVEVRDRGNGRPLTSFEGHNELGSGVVMVGESIFVSATTPFAHVDVFDGQGVFCRTFKAPTGRECRGMDWDGSRLWVADNSTTPPSVYTMSREGELLQALTVAGPVRPHWLFDIALDPRNPGGFWLTDQSAPWSIRYCVTEPDNGFYRVLETTQHPAAPTWYPEGIGFWSSPSEGKTYLYTVGSMSPQIWHLRLDGGMGVEDLVPARGEDDYSLLVAPNPVQSRSRVAFSLPKAANVRLELFDVTGASRAVLCRGTLPAGYHTEFLNRHELEPGIYLLRLDAEGVRNTCKLVVR